MPIPHQCCQLLFHKKCPVRSAYQVRQLFTLQEADCLLWNIMYSDITLLCSIQIHCQILLDSHMYIWLKSHSRGNNFGHKLHKIAPESFHTLSSELTYVEVAAWSCVHPWQQAVYFNSWNYTTGFLLDIAVCFLNLK